MHLPGIFQISIATFEPSLGYTLGKTRSLQPTINPKPTAIFGKRLPWARRTLTAIQASKVAHNSQSAVGIPYQQRGSTDPHVRYANYTPYILQPNGEVGGQVHRPEMILVFPIRCFNNFLRLVSIPFVQASGTWMISSYRSLCMPVLLMPYACWSSVCQMRRQPSTSALLNSPSLSVIATIRWRRYSSKHIHRCKIRSSPSSDSITTKKKKKKLAHEGLLTHPSDRTEEQSDHPYGTSRMHKGAADGVQYLLDSTGILPVGGGLGIS